MTDQGGDRAYSDAGRAEGSSRADGAGLARGHQDPHDAIEQKHDGQRSRPHGPASHAQSSLPIACLVFPGIEQLKKRLGPIEPGEPPAELVNKLRRYAGLHSG